jgi:hemoglobin
MKHDIATSEDVRDLVKAFYDKLLADAEMRHFFADLDLPHHLPRIEAFWRGVLFGDRSYTGDPMTAHIALNKRHPMEQKHFDRWITHWNATLAELFSGPKAEEAKARAATIAAVTWKVKNS